MSPGFTLSDTRYCKVSRADCGIQGGAERSQIHPLFLELRGALPWIKAPD